MKKIIKDEDLPLEITYHIGGYVSYLIHDNGIVLCNYKLETVFFTDDLISSYEFYDDFYYDEVLTDPHQIDIDHLVPLQHAFYSGAKDWDEKKCENFSKRRSW